MFTDAGKKAGPLSVASRTLSHRAQRFAADESGVIAIFVLFLFVIMLAVGGIGIDVMRYERDRAKLQYTMDRAVLAAADLDQSLEPEAVVREYLEKADLLQFLTSVTVSEGLGFRNVKATAESEFPTQFMHMTGVDTLSAPAASTAEESIGGVEISMVLDVSGSMNSNNRLPNLKVAARDFVDQMVDNTEDGKLSISIIPYATQVSIPDNLMAEFNATGENAHSNCLNFRSSDFSTTTLNENAAHPRTMHFDTFTSSGSSRSDGRPYGDLVKFPVCEADSRREIMLLQKDRDTLKNFITALTARGNTSIDVGMKWGTAFLDHSMNDVVTNLIANGDIPNDFSARPHQYSDGETLKVIVLMTDGQNTSQYYLRDQYRQGDSNIWWNAEEEKYSVYRPATNRYYWPHNREWEDHPYGNGTYTETRCTGTLYYGNCYYGSWVTETITEPGSAERLTYPQLWEQTSLQYNLSKHYYPWMNDSQARDEWYYGVRSYVGSSTKNTRTQAICDAAKAQNVIVYTIGFEAPSGGLSVLKNCASSDSHFYDVDGLEISDAFASIASSIRKLRLTQ
ncbi:von Willebrand factor type A domain protein [Falsiruegeria litorea R37]|uniref:von Willebrand factor type A domain protein n=1 Tax=Falsiruegeria litorea R37 TaxID=1200284 RepID=A0A1Y5SYR9_9RHOB|nr:TadE/TadG family type IV pilus assembly protein [Falsiruegeria litorea]SLN48220.1 von Willebrand factor type A domain protein [Falsiruegeria litorea R37]